MTASAGRCVTLGFEQNAEYSTAFVLERVMCWVFATYDDMTLALPGFTEGGAIPKSPNGDCWLARAEGRLDETPTITRNPTSC